MKDTDRKLLEDDGWTVDCESPFELSREDGSRATGAAAWLVLTILRQRESLFVAFHKTHVSGGKPELHFVAQASSLPDVLEKVQAGEYSSSQNEIVVYGLDEPVHTLFVNAVGRRIA